MAALCKRSVLVVALSAVLSSTGCKGRDATGPVSPEPPAMRVATSFVHCVEAGKAQCVAAHQASTGWNALFLLSWLGSGSPVAILQSLPGELDAHGDHRFIEGRLVEEVERYAPAMRGAECDADRAEPFEPLIADAARSATERLERLGLLSGGMQAVIERLSQDAHRDLGDGHLVHMRCSHDPHHVYVAVRAESRGRQAVIGMTTLWPEHLGGEPLDRTRLDERLRSQGLGLSSAVVPFDERTVDPWLPFLVEEL
jgi:hypothetical protein